MPGEREFVTHSPEETVELGRDLARELTPPRLVLLRGDLGAGKTTLVKGIVEGYSVTKREQVTSPTFTLIHEYRSPQADIYHIDLYRVDTARELETLAIDDLLGARSLILVEWGEKFERFRRESDVQIVMERTGENERKISIRSLKLPR
jgi:tRNA threonylcarbamoyladenosine biosynthesis protein TsaE